MWETYMNSGKIISIHAPHTGSDFLTVFLPIPLLNFNPRSPHGERRKLLQLANGAIYISIHAPHTGSDNTPSRTVPIVVVFQSTLPTRGAT